MKTKTQFLNMQSLKSRLANVHDLGGSRKVLKNHSMVAKTESLNSSQYMTTLKSFHTKNKSSHMQKSSAASSFNSSKPKNSLMGKYLSVAYKVESKENDTGKKSFHSSSVLKDNRKVQKCKTFT